jgi:hypothetical protein
MDGVVRRSGAPEAPAQANRFGLKGFQVTLGRATPDGRLPLEDAALQAGYPDAGTATNPAPRRTRHRDEHGWRAVGQLGERPEAQLRLPARPDDVK